MNANEVIIHDVKRGSVRMVIDLFEKPFVKSVKRRMCIIIKRADVETLKSRSENLTFKLRLYA